MIPQKSETWSKKSFPVPTVVEIVNCDGKCVSVRRGKRKPVVRTRIYKGRMMIKMNKSQIFEHLSEQAARARKEDNQLMLALIAACDESLRHGMVITSNHIAALIILCQDMSIPGATEKIERAVTNLYGLGDMILKRQRRRLSKQNIIVK